MILELKDEEILEFLMTSEFEEDYKPEEFRYLLSKFRYFYRILNGKYELNVNDSNGKINRLQELLDDRERIINELLVESADKTNLIDSLKNRKLTLKERVSGKIITENED